MRTGSLLSQTLRVRAGLAERAQRLPTQALGDQVSLAHRTHSLPAWGDRALLGKLGAQMEILLGQVPRTLGRPAVQRHRLPTQMQLVQLRRGVESRGQQSSPMTRPLRARAGRTRQQTSLLARTWRAQPRSRTSLRGECPSPPGQTQRRPSRSQASLRGLQSSLPPQSWRAQTRQHPPARPGTRRSPTVPTTGLRASALRASVALSPLPGQLGTPMQGPGAQARARERACSCKREPVADLPRRPPDHGAGSVTSRWMRGRGAWRQVRLNRRPQPCRGTQALSLRSRGADRLGLQGRALPNSLVLLGLQARVHVLRSWTGDMPARPIGLAPLRGARSSRMPVQTALLFATRCERLPDRRTFSDVEPVASAVHTPSCSASGLQLRIVPRCRGL